jgi:hypothetical protein
LVTGTKEGESSPVRRLRATGDLWALRLLVDLYHAQNLSADGGISRGVLRASYTKKRYGQRGRHIIWGFFEVGNPTAADQPATECFWQFASQPGKYVAEKNTIWTALLTLISMGRLTCIPYLVENSLDDCELIHGCAWDGYGEWPEVELARLANRAGVEMIGESRERIANSDGVKILVPAWDTQPEVQLAGIYRLTYRPKTKLTEDWMRRMNETAQAWRVRYESVIEEAIKTRRTGDQNLQTSR